MAGLTLTLDTAEQTLLNTQTELQVSSNNISNAGNTWYAREVAVQEDNPDVPTISGWIGAGASVTQIMQIRNQYLEGQLMGANSDYSQYSGLASQLQSIQSADSDSGSTGITEALGTFFDSWDTLSQDASDVGAQSTVYQAAQNLASTIQSTYSSLNEIATNDIPGQIQDTVTQANSLIDQIAQLNTSIVQARADTSSSQPNGLIDQRYEAMESLSQLIPVSFSTASNGMVNVTTTDANGPVTIVSGETGTHITTSGTGTNITTSPAVTGGQLGGLLEAQTDLSGYMAQLNTFASSLVSQVNDLHTANGGPDVFSDTAGQEASTITASTTFLSGLGQSTADESSRATNIANLQATQLTFSDGTTGTLQDYLSNIQQQIGSDVQQANNNASYSQALKTQLQTQQQSVSGVSVDEEMVNVIQYQQIYQAAAKVVETASSLMSTAISMVPSAA
jgi:flagellar hook-associated protein 1 FlgK